jgi:hypothetical protein
MKSAIILNHLYQRLLAFPSERGKAGGPMRVAGLRSGGEAAMRLKAGRGYVASGRGQLAA